MWKHSPKNMVSQIEIEKTDLYGIFGVPFFFKFDLEMAAILRKYVGWDRYYLMLINHKCQYKIIWGRKKKGVHRYTKLKVI